jgi:hypothetical protein
MRCDNELQSPHPEIVKRHTASLRQICKQLDALNLLLDKAIASAEADIRHIPRNASLLASIKNTPADENKI